MLSSVNFDISVSDVKNRLHKIYTTAMLLLLILLGRDTAVRFKLCINYVHYLDHYVHHH